MVENLPIRNREFNEIHLDKQHYIRNMRKLVTKDTDIVNAEGNLNLKYFNVKKGQYWSKKENDALIAGVIEFGPTDYKTIKCKHLKNWSETEIRLRICRLLKVYELGKKYKEDFRFKDEAEIMQARKDNTVLENFPAGARRKYGITFLKESMQRENQLQMTSFVKLAKRTNEERDD